MSLPKGDIIHNKSNLLFGKYEIIRTLGQGSFSTVYLTRHQSLEDFCAIKVVPKQHAQSLLVFSEAQLLKSFHHDGIPRIYDLEEDEEFYYLIEEYICGQPLDEYLLQQKTISTNSFLTIMRQLCDIFIYLHSRIPSPVIYQDLKPQHILICGSQLKLIDFGVSTYLSDSGNQPSFFGNLLFTPPEVLGGSRPSIASDIFCLGKLMEYLLDYVKEEYPKFIQAIIHKSTDRNPSLRFETVSQIADLLSMEQINSGQAHLSQSIAVIGCHSGCGTTHIAISLCCVLNAAGEKAYYHEMNFSNAIRSSMPYMNFHEENGCIDSRFFHGYPLYGPGITIPVENNAYHIYDFGYDFISEELSTCDCILYVCDNALWHRDTAMEKFDCLGRFSSRLKVIGNRCTHSTALFYAKEFDLPIYLFEADSDPFRVTGQKQQFFLQLLNKKGRRKQFFKRKIKEIPVQK